MSVDGAGGWWNFGDIDEIDTSANTYVSVHRTDSVTVDRTIFSSRKGGSKGFMMWMDASAPGGYVRTYRTEYDSVDGGGGSIDAIGATDSAIVDTWQGVAGVYNSTTLKIRIDGTDGPDTGSRSANTSGAGGTADLTFHYFQSTNQRQWYGQGRYWCDWAVALTDDEIDFLAPGASSGLPWGHPYMIRPSKIVFFLDHRNITAALKDRINGHVGTQNGTAHTTDYDIEPPVAHYPSAIYAVTTPAGGVAQLLAPNMLLMGVG